MRILVVTSQYHRAAGYPRYSVDLIRALARRGHDVTVLTRMRTTEPADEALGIRFCDYELAAGRTLGIMASEPEVVTTAVERLGPDHDVVVSIGVPVLAPVVLIGLGTHFGYYRSTLSMLGPTSARYWVERTRPFHKVMINTERRMMRAQWPARVVVGADRFADEYRDLYGYPIERVDVVPMGIDLDSFRFDPAARAATRAELGIGDGTRLLFNLAGRARQKGLDVLVEALHRLAGDPTWTMVFAGDGSSSPWLARATADLVEAGRVRLAGRVPEVAQLYSAADLVVFPSRYDPWGLVATEALAMGTPVVTTHAVGASVAVRDGHNGAVVPPDDAGALTAAVRSMLDALAAGPFDRAALRDSVRWLTYDEGAARLEATLERAAGAHHRHAGADRAAS